MVSSLVYDECSPSTLPVDRRRFGASLVLQSVLLFGLVSCDRPVLVEGRPLNYWVGEMQRSGDNGRAMRNVARFGKRAVQPLTAALKDRREGVRRDAVTVLGTIGPCAEDAVPEILQVLRDRSRSQGLITYRAVEAVGRIGRSTPGLEDALVAVMSSGDRTERFAAAEALARLESGEATLSDLVDERGAAIRAAMAHGAGFLSGPVSSRILSALGDALTDADETVRFEALLAVRRLGVRASPLAGRVQALAESNGFGLGAAAAATLLEIREPSSSEVEGLVARLNSSEPRTRAAAASRLGSLGTLGRSAEGELARVAKGDEIEAVRLVASSALRAMGSTEAGESGRGSECPDESSGHLVDRGH